MVCMNILEFILVTILEGSKLGLVNLAILLVGLFLVNLYADFDKFRKEQGPRELSSLESEARARDSAYYRQCLAETDTQVFFPALIGKTEIYQLSQKTGFLPISPIPNSATAYCNEGYGLVRYQSDRFGFRNADQRWSRPIDMMIIGDSFMQGACVEKEHVVSEQLAKQYNVNAVNVATASAGPHHYTRVIETFVPIFGPRHVILVFYANDNVPVSMADPHRIEAGSLANPDYTSEGVSARAGEFYRAVAPLIRPKPESPTKLSCDRLPSRSLDIRAKIEKHHQAWLDGKTAPAMGDYLDMLATWDRWKKLITMRSLRTIASNLFEDQNQPQIASPETTQASISALLKQCVDPCQPSVVLLPNSNYWRPDHRMDAYFDFIIEQLASFSAPGRVRLLDMRGKIDQDKLESFAPVGPHYSTKSYKLVADGLAELLLWAPVKR